MHKECVYKFSAKYDNSYFPLKKSVKTAFSRRFGGFTAAQNQKRLIIWTVYVVNSVCTNF